MIAAISHIEKRKVLKLAKEGIGKTHAPGTVRSLNTGWKTPLHMDSKHSGAWVALRKKICNETVPLFLRTSLTQVANYRAMTRHSFAASGILTLHEPDRTMNPYDLNIYRTRWPLLLGNCKIKTLDAYGVGARFIKHTVPQDMLSNPVRVLGGIGDVFIFNSEFLHDTPLIKGTKARTVFNTFIGYSMNSNWMEMYA